MTQNLDKNKIRDSIQNARPQDMLYIAVNPADKNSKKNAFAQIEKFIGKENFNIVIYR